MSWVLIFLGGSAAGAAVSWLVLRRTMKRWSAPSTPFLDIPDDFELPSDTAMHIAAGLEAETAFEPLAYVLVEKVAARLQMNCAIAMREVLGGKAVIATVSGGLDRRMKGIEIPLDSLAGRAFTDALPVVAAPDEKVVTLSTGDRRRSLEGGLAVPIMQGSLVYGAVIGFGEPPTGTADAIAGATELVRKFGPVLVPAHAAMVAMRRAQTDELTGLPNRRAFTAAMAGNTRERAALIALDIDHFKAVNDTFGHEAGDEALKHVARIIREQVRWRDGDVAARIGGEEFAVWLPGASLGTAMEIAERTRVQIEASPFRYGQEQRRITVSLGVTAFPDPIGAIQNLMNVADAALYQAKRGGRNRVIAGRQLHMPTGEGPIPHP